MQFPGKLEFTTPRGAKITLEIVTEYANLADHTVTNRCWEMRLSVNGNWHTCGWELGKAANGFNVLKAYIGGTMIQIPDDNLDAVTAWMTAYKAEFYRRYEERNAREAASYRRKSAAEMNNDRIDAEDAALARGH